MGLVLWLPFNGNLNNQGLNNDITITNNGATISSEGKIGQCYEFSKDAYIDISKNAMDSFTFEASVCFWFKIKSWNTAWDTLFQAGKGGNAWTQYTFGILRNNSNALCFAVSDGSDSSQSSYSSGNISLDTWYHICCVYKFGHCLIYLNGELVQDYETSIIPAFSSITSIKVGGLASNYMSDSMLNDLRIYDHALSKREVKEISRGLVRHYTLSDRKNPNIVDTSLPIIGAENGSTVPIINGVKIDTSFNGNIEFGIPLAQSLVADTYYTISFYCLGVNKDDIISFNINNNTLYVKDGFNKMNMLISENISNSLQISCNTRPNNPCPLMFTWIKIEAGEFATPYCLSQNDPRYQFIHNDNTIEYDVSGYGHNGQIKGTLLPGHDGMRYAGSTAFPGAAANYILADSLPVETKSVSVWIRMFDLQPDDFVGMVAFADYNSHLCLGTGTGGNFVTYCGSGNGSTGSAVSSGDNYKENEWNHLVIISTGSKTRDCWLNGVKLTHAKAAYYRHLTDNLMLGRRELTTYPFQGEISDFRAYTTVLTEEDVLELYHTSSSLSSNGKLFTTEFVEV